MRLPTQLSHRSLNAHKGDFGHVFILAGSGRFSGAAVLAGTAALRSGSGLVTLGIPRGINNALIKIKPPELMTLPLQQTREGGISKSAYPAIKKFLEGVDVLIVGPGLGREKSAQMLVRKLIAETRIPTVVDADGLNALAGHLKFLKTAGRKTRADLIFTPHAGEMARLAGSSVKAVEAGRADTAKKFAREHHLTVVLKGHSSVLAEPGGKCYVNKTGNPGMATAGSGDVLAGMVGAFLGQGLNAFEAARYGLYVHGLAGDLAAKEKTQISLIASDIIDKIPEAIKRCS